MYIVQVYNTYVYIFLEPMPLLYEWELVYDIWNSVWYFHLSKSSPKVKGGKIQPKKERSKYECTKRKVRLKLWLRTNLSFTAKYTLPMINHHSRMCGASNEIYSQTHDNEFAFVYSFGRWTFSFEWFWRKKAYSMRIICDVIWSQYKPMSEGGLQLLQIISYLFRHALSFFLYIFNQKPIICHCTAFQLSSSDNVCLTWYGFRNAYIRIQSVKNPAYMIFRSLFNNQLIAQPGSAQWLMKHQSQW